MSRWQSPNHSTFTRFRLLLLLLLPYLLHADIIILSLFLFFFFFFLIFAILIFILFIYLYKGSPFITLFFSFIAYYVLTSFVLITTKIMSFCKKSLHSFLSFTYLSDTNSPSPPSPPLHKCHPGSLGIGLVTATGDTRRPPNVLESATVGPPPPRLPTQFHSVFADVSDGLRKASDGILAVGFFEEVGEVVDGLMSCTESLGFESSDERRADEGVCDLGNDGGDSDLRLCLMSRAKRREESERMRERKFPPPITSLNDKGRPSFFLRPLRRDGRLELAEVRIDRPEILRASREDGRLRLEFVKDLEELEENADEVEIEIEEDGEEAEDTTLEGDVRGEEWKVPISGEGFGRCHDVVSHGHGHSHGHSDCHPHHHHQNLHVWRQHCVTIR